MDREQWSALADAAAQLPAPGSCNQQPQRWLSARVFEAMVHDLRALGRLAQGRYKEPTATILDSRTLRSTPESGNRSGYDGAKRKRGSKMHAAVDTLGHLLALHLTPASEHDREEVEKLAWAVQEATGDSVQLAYVDQGYTGEQPAKEATEHGIHLEVVKHKEARRGFVLLPRRWVVERDFAWASRFRRLFKDYERLPETVAGLHFVAFTCLFLQRAISVTGPSLTSWVLITAALGIKWWLVELVVLILVVAVVLLVLTRGGRYLGHLIVNAIVGVALLFLTNLVIADDIPINLLTVLICAIGGVIGWLIILVLHLLGVAFYVPA